MRPINLIPPEDRRGERAPLRSGPLPYVVIGVLLLAFVGVYAMVGAGNSVTENEARVATLEQELTSATARADALRSFSEFAALEQARSETVSQLAASRFDWERVLRELALVLPEGVTIEEMSGSITGDTEGASGGGIEAPNARMSGCATGQETVAGLVAALRDIDGVTRVGLSNSATAGEGDAAATASTTAASSGGSTGSGCGDAQDTSFEVTIAFDGVVVAEAGEGVPPEPPTGSPDVGGVADAEAERAEAEDSVNSAQDESREAVNDYVPGA